MKVYSQSGISLAVQSFLQVEHWEFGIVNFFRRDVTSLHMLILHERDEYKSTKKNVNSEELK